MEKWSKNLHWFTHTKQKMMSLTLRHRGYVLLAMMWYALATVHACYISRHTRLEIVRCSHQNMTHHLQEKMQEHEPWNEWAALVFAGCMLTWDVYNLIWDLCNIKIKVPLGSGSFMFLLGQHPRVGKNSSVYKNFVKDPLYDKNLTRLLLSYCEDEVKIKES